MSAELRAGQTFGGYHIVELVGSGGMGLVYRAEQRILGRTVVLKVIRPEIAESGDYRARFLREARFAAAVDHPHVVSVFDAGEQEVPLYLAMQWVDGLDLGTLLDREQRLAPERTVLIGVQLAQALQAVHDAGLVHRDVKPSNVLVRDIGGRDHAYLYHFGIARRPPHKSLTRTGWVMGYSRLPVTRTDPGPAARPAQRYLYALGCIISQALTGQRPFGGDDDLAARWAQATSPPPVASTLYPALGSRYDAFLAQALAINPQDRFPRAPHSRKPSGRPHGAAGRPDTGSCHQRRPHAAGGVRPIRSAASRLRDQADNRASSSGAQDPAVLQRRGHGAR